LCGKLPNGGRSPQTESGIPQDELQGIALCATPFLAIGPLNRRLLELALTLDAGRCLCDGFNISSYIYTIEPLKYA